MITLNAVHARMRRQKIEEFAGTNYVPGSDVLKKVPYLQKVAGEQFLFGIYCSEKKWTVLSVNYLYAAYDGQYSILRLDTETQTIFRYFSDESDFCEHVSLKDGRRIWMKSPEFASLMLNLMMMLEKVPCGTALEP